MSAVEVCERLSACRWANEDRRDPYFAEALDEAALEPALAQWWEQQRALDDIFARRLRELSVPAALEHALSRASAADCSAPHTT